MGFRYSDILIDNDNELHSTIYGMISDDPKERFKAEYKQLIIRLEKLNETIDKYNRGELDYNVNSTIGLLKVQATYMNAYAGVLRDRAYLEGVNLD